MTDAKQTNHDLTSLLYETVLCGPYVHQLWKRILSWLRNHNKAQWLLYVPLSLTHKNSTFCPHNVFMCLVWIWEQTATIAPYSINWLVFITETCVYCAVRTEYYLHGFAFVLNIHIYPSAWCYFQKVTRAKPGNFPKSSVLSEIGDQVIRVLVLFFDGVHPVVL